MEATVAQTGCVRTHLLKHERGPAAGALESVATSFAHKGIANETLHRHPLVTQLLLWDLLFGRRGPSRQLAAMARSGQQRHLQGDQPSFRMERDEKRSLEAGFARHERSGAGHLG